MSRNLIRSFKTSAMTLSHNPKIVANKYFSRDTGKDVWTLTNESAALAATNAQNKGRDMLNLGQGFFSYAPPEFAINEAKNALDIALVNQYSPTRGRQSLIKSLIDFYNPIYSTELKPENVSVFTGANEAILSCLTGLLNQGDEVIVFEPFFDQYIPNIEMCGGKVVYVPINPPKALNERVTRGTEWEIDWNILEKSINDKTKAIIINTPHNPIGKVFTKEELLKLGELCVKNNIVIISDEVYEHLYFTETFTRIATLSPEIGKLTLTVGSAGKSFAATGWRIGWTVSLNEELLGYAAKAHTRICFSSPSPLQEAVANGLTDASKINYFPNMRQQYIRKYEIFTKVFDELSLPYTAAEGSYFILVNFAKVKIPNDYKYPEELLQKGKDFRISYWLMNELGVVAIPPTEFYIKEHEKAAENLLRFALCKDDEYLERSVERLRLLKNYL
ncbi:similar to Saccharomyces cerevisiae YJL060W BNA3 Kynurenine aminotransferase, catalyzes formation of kynurenic acid from kynurenine [Maudiozyma saulgeensis]|uniref:Similar to Saccharomyces cerevisiae YJL060W BNA3 Kynurenine aminotransferase, catalyzes formation of kynurenic acid from kynurenine n=1 Tax=Maudiozyma saulgeensis TaxID=1789683 RepID=A0A1X7R8N5_9SACH|nr:similar to Saccharomyces cerevisiae YJL060W BNA3 Kynurenine aminotransferase, catalyzes formation of kynurenic acid from kynurenine [Kazachstania saulgeensis]